jgi:hypothetical protein
MKIKFLVLALLSNVVFAQKTPFKKHFVNMTEIGVLMGSVVYDQQVWDGWGGQTTQSNVVRRVNFTMQTFNGLQIKPRLAVGGTVGLDWYSSLSLLPISLGLRYDITGQSAKKVGLFGAFDAGYGFAVVQPDPTGYNSEGGLMLNPGIGVRFGAKSGRAFVLTLGYKLQQAHINKSVYSNEIYKYEDRTYQRLAMRMGVSF